MNDKKPQNDFPLEKQNFLFIGAGSLIVIIGYFLMSGGGADDVTSFSQDVFSARRMYVAPLTILIGYGLVMYGIVKK